MTLAAVHDVLTEQAKTDAAAERVSAQSILHQLIPLLRRMADVGRLRGIYLG